MKRALITGITGQDGSYLAEFLLEKGYQVFGLVRRSSTMTWERLTHIKDRLTLIEADVLDQPSLLRALRLSQPDEVYHLAAMSFVGTSFHEATATAEYTALGVTRMLESLRMVDWPVRFYQASSSEMFGKVYAIPQNEKTPFYPRSPYGVAKLYGHWLTVNYRESYDLFACSGILFNHESPRRGMEFVTRKIAHAVARISLGLQDKILLGNLEAKRDWGFAGDYVRAMWLMLQQEQPDDYVIATGECYRVRDFVQEAFACIGIEQWQSYVEIDPALLRPAEVDLLVGDASKARQQLEWKPSVSFQELVRMMVQHDIELLKHTAQEYTYGHEHKTLAASGRG
ncbi:MAG TPA: GDP-mannose 4,6-dehydratase [Ktedonosporobacter sp.]|nr:GDP-mannose 4,6-dehydratase [Ktedonosporobacter sp.]